MAKKGARIIVQLECQVCKGRNYTTFRHRDNPKEKIVIKKHCPRCRKHTDHKETKISKK